VLEKESATSARSTAAALASGNESYTMTLAILTSLFFIWGFISCLNDILVPHLKSVFSLNYTQAMLVQFCFFGAYFVVSLPAHKLIKRIGYKLGLVTGLSITGCGCLIFYPAAGLQSYPVFLMALFVLASGITCLQVSANPYVANLGAAKTASSRLSLTQAFNSLGTTVAPFFGGMFILSAVTLGVEEIALLSLTEQAALKTAQAQSVQVPYLILASILFCLASMFAFLKLPEIKHIESKPVTSGGNDTEISAWNTPHLMLGAVGIFVYVGAEVGIGSLLINFLGQESIAGLPESQAANYIAYYWGGAMVGRFIGALTMRYIAANKVLAFNAFMAMILLFITILSTGKLAMWAILAVGLCNSIMFPTIFTLAVNGLGHATSQGSGILCLAIVGGAFIPLTQGMLADTLGIQLSFVLPVLCYFYIAFYGLKGSQIGK
jgi:FHS family L-fucose permease-like MFS transporter